MEFPTPSQDRHWPPSLPNLFKRAPVDTVDEVSDNWSGKSALLDLWPVQLHEIFEDFIKNLSSIYHAFISLGFSILWSGPAISRIIFIFDSKKVSKLSIFIECFSQFESMWIPPYSWPLNYVKLASLSLQKQIRTFPKTGLTLVARHDMTLIRRGGGRNERHSETVSKASRVWRSSTERTWGGWGGGE